MITDDIHWGNPFRVDKDGTREQVVDKFLDLLVAYPGRHRIRAQKELKGKDLVCHCAPGELCHGDVLLEWANPDQTPHPVVIAGELFYKAKFCRFLVCLPVGAGQSL